MGTLGRCQLPTGYLALRHPQPKTERAAQRNEPANEHQATEVREADNQHNNDRIE